MDIDPQPTRKSQGLQKSNSQVLDLAGNRGDSMMNLGTIKRQKTQFGGMANKSVVNPSAVSGLARGRPNSSLVGFTHTKNKANMSVVDGRPGSLVNPKSSGPKFPKGGTKRELAEFKAREGWEFLPRECKPVQRDEFKEKKELNCSLCLCSFRKFTDRARHHCRRCGQAVCSTCFKNSKYLSQTDNEKYDICDECDFSIANPHLELWAGQIKNLQNQTYQDIANERIKYDKLFKEQCEKEKKLQADLAAKKQVFKEMQERLFKEKEDLDEKIKTEQSKISGKKKAITQFDTFIKDIRQEINLAKQQNRKLQDSLANYREQAEAQAREREQLEIQLSSLPDDVA